MREGMQQMVVLCTILFASLWNSYLLLIVRREAVISDNDNSAKFTQTLGRQADLGQLISELEHDVKDDLSKQVKDLQRDGQVNKTV